MTGPVTALVVFGAWHGVSVIDARGSVRGTGQVAGNWICPGLSLRARVGMAMNIYRQHGSYREITGEMMWAWSQALLGVGLNSDS